MSDRPYDPFDYDTWPQAQKSFVGRVQHGLLDGDLQPLADYLRAGHYIFPNLATMIADAIEGKDMPEILTMRRATRSPLNTTQRFELEARRTQIGVYTQARVNELGKGKTKVAIGEAMDKFQACKTEVTDARAIILKFLGESHPALRDQVWESLLRNYLSADIG
ncbi:MAG: hypothetical protein JWR80_8111 [Bradyrhizobium sp.]|nr:hypothetical protein [Bradyrhizobium sp.]